MTPEDNLVDVRWLWTVLPGACVVAFAFREIFQDLFHPTHSGSFSDWVGRTTFRLLRHWPSILSMAGPLTLVIVILSWAFLQAFGFALIYWVAFPDAYQLNPAQQTSAAYGLWTMLYFSFESLTTLGLGDVLPKANWLRLLTTFQALTGLALITASVSFILLIFPALARLRSLARRTEILIRAARSTGVDVVSGNVEHLLDGLATDVIRVRVDFIHFPILYYFHSERGRSSLARSLPDLLGFAEAGLRPDAPEPVRFAAAALRAALEDLARVLSRRFIHAHTDDPGAIFRAYAEEHMVAPGEKP